MQNRYLQYGIVLLVIAAASAGVLAIVNNFTGKIITENENKIKNQARQIVLPEATNFKDEESKEVKELTFIPGYDSNENKIGYVVFASESGYAGEISFILGLDLEGKIKGLDIIGSQETPGLGAKINDQEWKEHWIGLDETHEFNKSVDGFSGATVSPMAVYNGIKKTITIYKEGVIN